MKLMCNLHAPTHTHNAQTKETTIVGGRQRKMKSRGKAGMMRGNAGERGEVPALRACAIAN